MTTGSVSEFSILNYKNFSVKDEKGSVFYINISNRRLDRLKQ
ncbi:hypothetical protein [Apilactobacillus micheneri]|nr:hypothetical protein [Apilactobacillus micheneri]GAY79914.1 hypothetical protein NBRC113063_00778 [Apilactobacillus micheneri]